MWGMTMPFSFWTSTESLTQPVTLAWACVFEGPGYWGNDYGENEKDTSSSRVWAVRAITPANIPEPALLPVLLAGGVALSPRRRC